MSIKRSSGILLHPSSLPGKEGIGTFGQEAFDFIDFLEESNQKLWQILPLGPTGYGDSPYQCFSAIAGNPILISLQKLMDDELLLPMDLPEKSNSITKVDYGTIHQQKIPVLRKAFDRFKSKETKLLSSFKSFCKSNADWLDDYALFIAIKEKYLNGPWSLWPEKLKKKDFNSIQSIRSELHDKIEFQQFQQFIFSKQWNEVRRYARKKGVKIIGDIPLYVSLDSVEAWMHPELFEMDAELNPINVAGVPPDYFSKTGQLWGNPIYNWPLMKNNGFKWWISRIKANLNLYDIIRIDHFRGLESYWSVPFGEETAVKGVWIKAPGKELLEAVYSALGKFELIAEDLGDITEEVTELRDHFNLPGMKILQFAFDQKADNEFLPHTYEKNCVVYSGTHDNDTVESWFSLSDEKSRQQCIDYLNVNGNKVSWALIRAAWSSVGEIAIAPMQDLLSLGNDARMNLPGTTMGNWQWRAEEDHFSDRLAKRLKMITELYNR